jgi:hypothetical protein
MTAPLNFSFTDESDAISPTFWQGPVGSRIRYSMAIQYNALATAVQGCIYAGLPSLAPPDAIQWAAADRQIDPGPKESQAHFAGRLQQWLTRSAFYGTPTGVLLALRGYTHPAGPSVLTVSSSPGSTGSGISIWNSYSTSGETFPTSQAQPNPPNRVQVAANWNWDGASDPWYGVAGWWRAWVVIYSGSGSPWSTPTSTIGGFHLGDGTALNWGGSQADVTSLTTLVRKWRSAHNTVPAIMVAYSSSLFDQTKSFGNAALPDGHYGHWGKVSASAITASSRTDYNVTSAGGFASVYVPSSSVSLSTSVYSSVYVPARTIGPASYIDGI